MSDPTPELAFEDQDGYDTNGHLSLTFVWDTDFDLPDEEADVRLRFGAHDGFELGATLVTAVFRIDNNTPPVAILDAGSVLTNPDRKRGIPVPFDIVDPEGDDVLVVLQYRRTGELFPNLPADPIVISAILADPDPAQRRALRICEEFPIAFEGCHSSGYQVHLSSAKLVHPIGRWRGAQFGQAGPPWFG